MVQNSTDDGLSKTMLARAAGMRTRMVFAAVYAVVLAPVAGWTPAACWIAAYGLLHTAEYLLFATEKARTRAFRPRLALAVLSLNSVIYGALALMAIVGGGSAGLICGGLFLAGAVLNTVVTNQRSQAAYVAAMTPFGVYLLLTAGMAWAISGASTYGIAVGMVGVLLVFSSTILWRAAAEALDAQRRAREEAERGRGVAEAAAEVKSAFMAMVSHELRTPISAILAGAEVIERRGGTDAAAGALIAQSGRMMRTLLNDLLDLSKMEAGRMSIETVAFDLDALVGDTAAFWRAEAEKKGLRLERLGAETLPASVAGDPTRLRQILNNLISNAIKFTDRGAVILAVSREGEAFRFAVADTGRGLTPDEISRLFSPFEQGQASTARTHGGTGLGLSISRQLARLMGGDLVAESLPDQGAVFTLSLDLAEPAGETVDEAAPAAPAELGAVRVLVVDDHEVNRRAVALMLEPFGVELTAVASGEEGLALAAARVFDVILMDVYMPEMDGHETCRRLRATPGPNRRTPVIACTASASSEDWAACMVAGMNDHVAKPIDPAALTAAIARVLPEVEESAETAVA
ncbi:ATP-binding protein [Phenylobacterium sp.]|uniref:ATP-binding protein n=1 Tax=Phenylobacterium sp. TaxID=1871053 RepID=UPI0027277422|nr:ATP-binding protein [Phenylobacterium sp.]MDO8380086.1 ATP-binding protein [Phenylobacterium sp.]